MKVGQFQKRIDGIRDTIVTSNTTHLATLKEIVGYD